MFENVEIESTGNTIQEAELVEAPAEMLEETECTKIQVIQDVRDVLQQLESQHPGITEGTATALGAGTGAVGALAALSTLGVSGLSGAGVATGLAAAGGLLGGGLLLGIGVLATPVAALGVIGYRLGKKRKTANSAAALGQAAKKICDIQSRLVPQEDFFREELANIRTTLEILTRTKTA